MNVSARGLYEREKTMKCVALNITLTNSFFHYSPILLFFENEHVRLVFEPDVDRCISVRDQPFLCIFFHWHLHNLWKPYKSTNLVESGELINEFII